MLVHIFYGGLSQHNQSCLDIATEGNLMHKLTDASIKIIEAMASNAYNGMGDRRILRRSSRVHQVKANSSGLPLNKTQSDRDLPLLLYYRVTFIFAFHVVRDRLPPRLYRLKPPLCRLSLCLPQRLITHLYRLSSCHLPHRHRVCIASLLVTHLSLRCKHKKQHFEFNE
ncbi:hypothetical protein JHK86_022024 [Glycine max]|nr:hypothetical protein JHK86_022024 [Glycine max]